MTFRTIRQLVTRPQAVSLPPGATVAEACRVMRDHRIGAVLVMDQDDLQGIFTERDAVYRVLAEGLDPGQTRLDQVMTRELVTLEPETAAVDALRLMSQIGFRHLPIVEAGRVQGVISLRDFVGAELQQVDRP
jgi:CBS domain-containing protein